MKRILWTSQRPVPNRQFDSVPARVACPKGIAASFDGRRPGQGIAGSDSRGAHAADGLRRSDHVPFGPQMVTEVITITVK